MLLTGEHIKTLCSHCWDVQIFQWAVIFQWFSLCVVSLSIIMKESPYQQRLCWIYPLPLKEKAQLVFTLLFSFNMCILGLYPQLLRARAVMVLKACLCFSSTPHAAESLRVSSSNTPQGKVIDLPLDVALRLLTVCKCRRLSSLHHWGKATWNSLLDVALRSWNLLLSFTHQSQL